LARLPKFKIYLIGWHNQGAHGDDLLALTLRDLFDRAAGYTGMEIDWVDTPKAADYIIVGGGTLLGIDNLGILDTVTGYSKPFCIFGTGFRRETRDIGENNIRELRTLLDMAEHVFLRGYSSHQFCIQAGVNNTQVVGDPAINFSPNEILLKKSKEVFKIGISIRSMESQAEPQYTCNENCINIVSSIANHLTQKANCRFYFFDLAENIYDSDLIAINETIARMPAETQYEIIDHGRGALEHFSMIGQMDYIISQRLHPSVVGWVLGVPHICLDYQNCKTEDFLSTLGMMEFCMRTDDFNLETYCTKYERLMSEKAIIQGHASASVQYWREKQVAGASLVLRRAII